MGQAGNGHSGSDGDATGQGRTSRRKDDWQEVSDNFSRLGRMLQDRFVAGGPAQGAEGDVRDAMRSLGDALNRWGEQVSAAASDPELRDQAGRAARAFSTAVGSAFGSMADELSSMMRGQRRPRPDEEPWLTATDDLGKGGQSGQGGQGGQGVDKTGGSGGSST
jgi:hypothetical protein